MSDIIDNEAAARFEVTKDGFTAELTYRINGGRLVLIHTGVPDELGGHGLGGELVKAAVRKAAAEGLTIVPLCPYAREWLQKHDDAAGDVTIDWVASS
jgi:uncharacterized protein